MFCSIVRYKLYYSPAQNAGKAYDLRGAPVERLGKFYGHTAAEPGGKLQLNLSFFGTGNRQFLPIQSGVIALVCQKRNSDHLRIGRMIFRRKRNLQAGSCIACKRNESGIIVGGI